MINKLLYCGYEGDGHTVYKCLKCYKTWTTGNYDKFKYCPYCGILFEGYQENKKEKRLENIYNFQNKRKNNNYKIQNPIFVLVIETRIKWNNQEHTSEWKIDKLFALINKRWENNHDYIKRWIFDDYKLINNDQFYIYEYRYYLGKYEEYKQKASLYGW